MWGVGATVGPYVMGYVLSQGWHWTSGYRTIAIFQLGLTLVLFLTLPLWKERKTENISIKLFPYYMLVILVLMFVMHKKMLENVRPKRNNKKGHCVLRCAPRG